jgi:hypothetical protein
MEVEVIKPMLFNGKRLEPGADGEANPVIDLPVSDAAYLEGIGRVRRLPAQDAAEPVAKGKSKGK